MRILEVGLVGVIGVAFACGSQSPSTGARSASADLRSAGKGGERVQIRDDCDTATFDAVLGPGGCLGNGGTTFQEFIDELTATQTAEKWRFNDDDFDIAPGATIVASNRGGEQHTTFTRVAEFGGGFVPFLNDLSGNPDVAPECASPAVGATVVPSGGSLAVTAPASGTVKFQCCIHPWMRTVATVKR